MASTRVSAPPTASAAAACALASGTHRVKMESAADQFSFSIASVAAASHSASRRAGVRHGGTSPEEGRAPPPSAGAAMSQESHSPSRRAGAFASRPSILLLRGCRRRPRGGRRFAPALHLFVVAESLDELAGRLDLGEVRAFELDGRHRPSLHLRRKSGVRGRERANPACRSNNDISKIVPLTLPASSSPWAEDSPLVARLGRANPYPVPAPVGTSSSELSIASGGPRLVNACAPQCQTGPTAQNIRSIDPKASTCIAARISAERGRGGRRSGAAGTYRRSWSP